MRPRRWPASSKSQQKLGAGEDFAKLAEEYSDDTGQRGAGRRAGLVCAAAGSGAGVRGCGLQAATRPISDPVKTQFGYHLIQVEERDPARSVGCLQPFSCKKYEAYNTWLTDLRAAAKIDRNWTLEKVPPTPAAQ